MFGKPQTYARFLGSELRFAYTGRLIIAMPQGFGTRLVPTAEAQALRAVKINGTGPDALVRAGMAAVRAGAAAAGVTLPVLKPTPEEPVTTAPVTSSPPAPAPERASSLPVIAIAAGVAAAILLGGAGLLALRRPRRPSTQEG